MLKLDPSSLRASRLTTWVVVLPCWAMGCGQVEVSRYEADGQPPDHWKDNDDAGESDQDSPALATGGQLTGFPTAGGTENGGGENSGGTRSAGGDTSSMGGAPGTGSSWGMGGELSACPHFDPDDLVVEPDFAECDEQTPLSCPSGTHIDFDQSESCAVCSADTRENRTCSWSQTCFEPFLLSVAHSSGAMSCSQDDDCAPMMIITCGESVTLSLNAAINEELPMVAGLYAKQNCLMCGPDLTFEIAYPSRTTLCVDGACTLGD